MKPNCKWWNFQGDTATHPYSLHALHKARTQSHCQWVGTCLVLVTCLYAGLRPIQFRRNAKSEVEVMPSQDMPEVRRRTMVFFESLGHCAPRYTLLQSAPSRTNPWALRNTNNKLGVSEIGKDIELVNALCPRSAAPQQQHCKALRKAFTLHHCTNQPYCEYLASRIFFLTQDNHLKMHSWLSSFSGARRPGHPKRFCSSSRFSMSA